MDQAALGALDRQPYVSLATFRRSGVAVETPVWFAARDGKLYVFTEAKSGKVKRLRANPRIRLAPCGVRGRVEGDWLEGTARRVDDAAVVEAAYDALQRKYGWQMSAANFFSRLFGRIEGRAMLELEVAGPVAEDVTPPGRPSA
jgi:PPOX class probable F420-dependent enzyme